jgi:hypothetical protein
MANTTPEENKAATPVQGAGGATENKEQVQGERLTAETPEYVAELLKSNEEVIKSNQLVIDGINQFKESASDLLKDILATAKTGTTAAVSVEPELEEIDPKAKYVVTKDKSFRDSKDFTKEYKAGDDVTGLGEERLAHLVKLGHVEKKPK